METQANNNQNIEQQEEYITIKDLLKECRKSWYWFLVSVFFCLVAGVYIVISSPNIYERTAQLLVNDDMKGNQIGNDVTMAFSSMGIVTASSDVYNEVFVIKSPIIMKKVVERLKLNVNYEHIGTFKNGTLYGSNQPLEIEFLELEEGSSASMIVRKDEGSDVATITDFTQYLAGEEYEYGDKVEFTVNKVDTLSTPIGKIAVRPNASFKGDIAAEMKMLVNTCSVEAKVDAILAGLTSEMIEEHACIILLTYQDTSAKRAEDIINTLIEEYNNSWVDARNMIAKATSRFIQERLVVIEQELGDVDTDISTFKSQNLLPDEQAVSSIYLNRSAKADDEILTLTNQLQMAKYVRDYMNNNTHKFDVLPVNTGIGSSSIESQIVEYNSALVERQRLLSVSSESNPLVKDLDFKIESGRKTILEAVDNQIVALQNSIAGYQSSRAKADSKIAANPDQSKYLLSISRQQKVKEALYLYLLQKREENELGQTFAPYNSRLISYARGAAAPVSPKKMNILIAAFLLGVLIPFGVIFVRETTNTTVRGKKDLENLTVPYCGQIPLIGVSQNAIGSILSLFKKKKDFSIVVKESYTDGIGEAFRVVRSNITRLVSSYNLEESGKVIMVTSLHSGSGKTFISSNIAAAFAIKGKKVAIVDMDLRRHTLSDKLGHTTSDGVSNLLTTSMSISKCLIKDIEGIANLSLIPAGPTPPNPTEIVDSPKLKEIIEELKKENDVVILDCPPIEIVADTGLIAQYTDMTLFVVRVGLFERASLPEVQKYYDEAKFNHMAIVLNGSVSSGRAGYGYDYGYGYGYSYGKK